mgnify:CR=1 FL=1
MPYTEQQCRELYGGYEDLPTPADGADLNYVICRLLARFTQRHGLRYNVIAQARDAASGALHEYNRVVADPYEEGKRQLNGCVWGVLAHDYPA